MLTNKNKVYFETAIEVFDKNIFSFVLGSTSITRIGEVRLSDELFRIGIRRLYQCKEGSNLPYKNKSMTEIQTGAT